MSPMTYSMWKMPKQALKSASQTLKKKAKLNQGGMESRCFSCAQFGYISKQCFSEGGGNKSPNVPSSSQNINQKKNANPNARRTFIEWDWKSCPLP